MRYQDHICLHVEEIAMDNRRKEILRITQDHYLKQIEPLEPTSLPTCLVPLRKATAEKLFRPILLSIYPRSAKTLFGTVEVEEYDTNLLLNGEANVKNHLRIYLTNSNIPFRVVGVNQFIEIIKTDLK